MKRTDDVGLTPALCLQARKILGWSRRVLSEKARVTPKTICNFERNLHVPHAATVEVLRATLAKEGVRFVLSPGGGFAARLAVKKSQLI